MDNPYIAFLNINDRETISNTATAQPNTNRQILYYVSPANGDLIPVLETNISTGAQIYPSPAGNSLAYFRNDGPRTGLYIVNLTNGFSARAIVTDTLVQRGFLSEPQWSPDGQTMAIMLSTGYDMDIFLYNLDGSVFNLTGHGAYDLWPRWSPDGRFIAFVSDRNTCPSWRPNEPGACDPRTNPLPVGGSVHVIELATGVVRKISDRLVTEPPRWIGSGLLSFAGGDQTDILNPERTLWIANVETGQARQVIMQNEANDAMYLSEAWSPDGSLVIFQRATTTGTEIILMDTTGAVIAQNSDLVFSRFGMAAEWSPEGSRIAIGGTSGQCPHGIRVTERDLSSLARGNPPPTMCDPVFSPDGQYIAFGGISPNVDGRLDIYVSNANGFTPNNLTARLQGQNTFLGWVGGN